MIYYDIEVNREIILTMSYDNYDDFQHVNFVFTQKFVSLSLGLFNDKTIVRVR
jgi:hypothetical protein